MAAAETVPDVQQLVFPASSDDSADEPLTKRPRITGAALLAFVVAIVANLALLAILANSGDAASTAPAPAQPQADPAAAAPPAPVPGLPTSFGEGKFVIGTDIAPGTYHTTGAEGTQYCYWERFKNPDGAADSIIANHVGRGPATVTIDPGDGVFNTRFCGTWTKVN